MRHVLRNAENILQKTNLWGNYARNFPLPVRQLALSEFWLHFFQCVNVCYRKQDQRWVDIFVIQYIQIQKYLKQLCLVFASQHKMEHLSEKKRECDTFCGLVCLSRRLHISASTEQWTKGIYEEGGDPRPKQVIQKSPLYSRCIFLHFSASSLRRSSQIQQYIRIRDTDARASILRERCKWRMDGQTKWSPYTWIIFKFLVWSNFLSFQCSCL